MTAATIAAASPVLSEASLIASAWDLYRASGDLPWTPDVFWARLRLHALISPHADTYSRPVAGPDEGMIRWAYDQLTTRIAAKAKGET